MDAAPAVFNAMSQAFGLAATAKAVLLVTASSYARLLFAMIASALIARAIGPKDFGHYSYVIWIVGILAVIANNGLTSTTLRFISESLGRGDSAAARAIHGWLRRCQFATLFGTALLFLLTIQWTLPVDWRLPTEFFGAVVVVGFIAQSQAIFETSAAKGHGQFSVEAVASTFMSALNLMIAFGLYLAGASALEYIALFAFANIVYFVVARRMARSRGVAPTADGLDVTLRQRIVGHLGWTIVLTLAGAFGSKAAETYLLSKFVGAAELGYFAIAVAFARGGVELLAVGLNAVLMPLLAHGFGQGGAPRANVIFSNSVRLFTFGGLLLAGVGFMWADVAVSLIYGAQYHEATFALRVMVIVSGVTMAQHAFGALLSTTDNQKIRAFFAFASVLVSVATAIALVPRYGLYGAVASSATTSLMVLTVMCVAIVKVTGVELPWRELARLALAAATAALVAGTLWWFDRSLVAQFIAGLVFLLTYLVSTVLFAAWREQDLVDIRPLAKRYPRTLGRVFPWLERRSKGCEWQTRTP